MLDLLARQLSMDWISDRDGVMSRGDVVDRQVVLLKPATAINLTGLDSNN